MVVAGCIRALVLIRRNVSPGLSRNMTAEIVERCHRLATTITPPTVRCYSQNRQAAVFQAVEQFFSTHRLQNYDLCYCVKVVDTSMPTDPEKASDKVLYLPGLGSFSDVIASDADHKSAIYKRFDKLAARDLLYCQSELAELQAEQDQYDKEDAEDVAALSSNQWEGIRRNARNWAALKQSAKADSPEGRWRKRINLALEIRRTLKDYREALLLDSQLRALGAPDKQSMNTISNAFRHSGYSVLSGASSNLYPDPSSRGLPQENDYTAIFKQPESDLLTAFLKKFWPSLFGRCRTQSGNIMHAAQPQMSYFSIEMLNLTARLICTLLAAVLLITPMVSLYYVSKQKPGTTIALIVVFTVLFAATVALVTSAKRGEIFAATAAYAAVLVVFVSGDFAGSGG